MQRQADHAKLLQPLRLDGKIGLEADEMTAPKPGDVYRCGDVTRKVVRVDPDRVYYRYQIEGGPRENIECGWIVTSITNWQRWVEKAKPVKENL